MTLARRIAWLLAGVLLAALVGSLVLQALGLRQALQGQLEARNREAAIALAALLSRQTGGPAALSAAAAAQVDPGHIRRLLLRAPDGQPLLDLQRPAAPVAAPDWFVAALPVVAAPGRAKLADGGRDGGDLTLETQAGWVHEALWEACSRTAAWLAALCALAALVAAAMLRGWLRPLRATLAHAQALAQGRFVSAEPPRQPELRELSESLNTTALRLTQVLAAQAEQVALLQRQAQLDAVTGLPLRIQFVEQLQQRLAEPGGPRVAVMLVRVLHLEAINSRLGHETTDQLLGAVADLLLTYVDRVPGTFAGRLNGGDFALCLPVQGVARETAESLRTALAALPALRSGGAEAVVGGVDGLGQGSSGAALAAADAALASAEAGDGVAVTQEGDLVADAAGARAWREQIAAALDEGRVRLAEFGVFDREGVPIHLECPMRVQLSPGGEYQAAARWLALARRSRLLPQVDLRAVELALAAIAQDGKPRAVHAAQQSLSAPDFVADVAARLRAAPDAARQLSIEVNESAQPLVRDSFAAAAQAWRPFGVRIGVEHAGAAPQQLPLLHQAGVDYVKVDARHLRGVAGDEAVRGYAQSLIALIHGLGMSALAEGITDPRDLHALWALGFDGATGPALS